MSEQEKPRKRQESQLDYPFAAPPATGDTLELAEGVYWARMPLPSYPSHINVWALNDGDGVALVDTGVQTEETVAAWRQVFAGAFGGKKVTRVFVTHTHPDHVGLAGWITGKFNCRLWMTRLEYLTGRVMAGDTGREPPRDAIHFYRSAGCTDAVIEAYQTRFGNFGKRMYRMPDSYRRLHDGETFFIGQHEWRVVIGTGHSPEHAALYCPALKLLISGDQVLPAISSNHSVFPTEPDADPVAEWLSSLAKFKTLVPDDVLVLPAHGLPFRKLHTRLDDLLRTENEAIGRLRLALKTERRPVNVFGELFSTPTYDDPFVFGLATGETIACLNYLQGRGEVVKRVDDAGVNWYRLTPSAS